jgi:acyl dehydratase
VAVGDTIHPSLTVERVWQEGKRRFVRFATAITNQRGETVLEGFHLYRIIPRGGDAPRSEEGATDGAQHA